MDHSINQSQPSICVSSWPGAVCPHPTDLSGRWLADLPLFVAHDWSTHRGGQRPGHHLRLPHRPLGHHHRLGRCYSDNFICLSGFLTSSSTTRLYRGWAPRLTSHETKQGDLNFRLSWSHYTDTGPTRREEAATAPIEPRTSSPGVLSPTELPPPPPPPPLFQLHSAKRSLK